MLVSVIITTYRRPETLKRAVLSVLRQCPCASYRLELIVSDDDPAFTALPALADLQPEWPATVVLKCLKRGDGDGGVAESRNRALGAARGDWIVFLDDDDVLVEGALAALLDPEVAGTADVVAGRYVLVQEDARGTELAIHERPMAWTGHAQLLLHNVFPVGSYAIRRECITVPFDIHLRSLEDWLFLIDNLRHARVALVPQTVLRVHQVVDRSREHRNEVGGRAQRAADYARIYALHPAPHLAEQRRAVLAALGPVTVDELIGSPPDGERAEATLIATRQGRFLICDPQEHSQAALCTTGQFGPLAVAMASALARLRPGAVIDVGARIGTFAVAVGRTLRERTLICVEPQPLVFMHLCANLLANRLRNVSPRQQAIGRGTAASVRMPLRDAYSSGGFAEGAPDDGVSVPLASLDALGNGIEVSFVKVDAGRMTLDALQSGEALLLREKPTLLLDFEAENRRPEMLRYVVGLGYSALQIEQDCLAYHPDVVSTSTALAVLAQLGLHLPASTS